MKISDSNSNLEFNNYGILKTWIKVILLSLFLITFGESQFDTDCSDAPTPEIQRLRRIDTRTRNNFQRNNNRESIRPPGGRPGSPPWQQPIPVAPNTRGQSDGLCYLQSGAPLAMAYRKEYRMLTDNERTRFHYALAVLKQNGEYDRLSSEHQSVGVNSGAHSGPGFLPWHREFLKRVEIALRLIDPGLAIPYWDSVMDSYLPDPRDSILFSDDFIGGNGFIVSGPFAFWRTLEGRPYIFRNLAQEGQLFTEAQLNQVIQQTNVEYVLAYTVPLPGCPYPTNYGAIEYTHSNIHLWLGGDMKPPITSANDPIFYLHHSFVDLVWEMWRQARQPRWAFTPDLPQCANAWHYSFAQMRPFWNLINRDGIPLIINITNFRPFQCLH